MTRHHPYSTYRSAVLALFMFLLAVGTARGQTNDPFVVSGDQDYLFDIHRVDEAWSVTQGSPWSRIGVQSLTGVRYGHEDLAARTAAPSGTGTNRPELGYATEAAGIAGAVTNNSRGMAGVARTTELRTFSLLEDGGCSPSGGQCTSVDLGATTLYFHENAPADRMALARQAPGVKVHLFTYGIPSGMFNDYLGQQPVSSEALQNLPPPDPNIGNNPAQASLESIGEAVGDFFKSLCFGSGCYSPPLPFRAFQVETANAVIVDDDVVVAPMGDHGPYSGGISYAPALSDRYVVAVGGVELDQANQPFPWDQTVQRPYVDVAAIAKDVIATSGESGTAYRTDFGGTVAAASITAGVASLIKARRSMLTGEDVEQVLERTARDVGTTGHDNTTGHGVVDAGAALRYVRDNEFLHERTTSISNVSTQTADARTVTLTNFGQITPGGQGFTRARGTLKRFTGRVDFSGISPSSAPDVWVRWAGSDGIDTRIVQVDDHYESVSDFLIKSLRVVSVDATGFTVEGYYWRVAFLNVWGDPIEYGDLPASPQSFEVRYTVAAPASVLYDPLDVSIGGPDTFPLDEYTTWWADESGGVEPYDYAWSYRYPCPDDPPPPPPCNPTKPGGACTMSGEVLPMGPTRCEWLPTGTSYTITESFSPLYGSVELRLRVTDDRGSSRTAYRTVYVESGLAAGEGEQARGAGTEASHPEGIARSEATAPVAYALDGAAPNPFRGEARVHFALPAGAEVRLAVYDLLGREVAVLAEGAMEAGHHRARFDGRGLPAGVYVVRLTAGGAAGEFVGTARVTLLR